MAKKIDATGFFGYFRDCYKLDYKEFIVDNILSTKYKYKWFVNKTEELFNDDLPLIPYNNPKVAELQKDIELYKLEKKLFYACFFVLGSSDNPLVKDKRICAPLVLFPANIINREDISYLEIETTDFIINRSLLSKLDLLDETKGKERFIKEFTEYVDDKAGGYHGIKSLMDKYFSNVETEELLMNPNVWSAAKIRSYFSNNEVETDRYKVVPGAATVLVDKSQSSLRVLNDLSEIARKGVLNQSLAGLFNGTQTKKEPEFSFFKSRLNVDQYQALKNAQCYNSSVIVGPPGTGKSYTITSIVTDAVVNGKSVLVVSKTKQAVEVIRAMLEKDFRLKDYIIHTTGNKYKLSLKSKIQKYLSGISANKNINFDPTRLNEYYKRQTTYENKFKDYVTKELKLSDLEFKEDANLFDGIHKVFIKMGMGSYDTLFELFEKLDEVNPLLTKEIKFYCKRTIEKAIRNHSKIFRKDISLYYDALDASSFTEGKQILKNVRHQNILKVFPIWLAHLSDLNSVLPLQKDLFDLVIIDEATQCDIASALPAIYRAKHVIISGDPNQLRHYSFVSHAQQSSLLKKHGLQLDKMYDYRNRSILDFYISKVRDQEQITFLKEHFRSTPSLIEFSNQQFYEGQLEVLKSMPKHTGSSQIELIELQGERNKQGINEKEANALLKKLDQLFSKYKDNKIIPEIGIISLFSSQVNYLNKRIREKYDLKLIKKFNLLCGTPYNFQGSEREIVLISFALCDNTHHSAFIHANKPEVLNVAITRAKSYQYIFKSVSDSKLKMDSLIAQYFSFVKNFTRYNEEEVTIDKFQEEVAEELKKKGYKNIKCAYPIGGSLLDIFIENRDKHYFIDLIGYPGQFKDAFSPERYKTLGRMGIKTIPLAYSSWKSNKREAVRRIIKAL